MATYEQLIAKGFSPSVARMKVEKEEGERKTNVARTDLVKAAKKNTDHASNSNAGSGVRRDRPDGSKQYRKEFPNGAPPVKNPEIKGPSSPGAVKRPDNAKNLPKAPPKRFKEFVKSQPKQTQSQANKSVKTVTKRAIKTSK